jgi:hypothetical protein
MFTATVIWCALVSREISRNLRTLTFTDEDDEGRRSLGHIPLQLLPIRPSATEALNHSAKSPPNGGLFADLKETFLLKFHFLVHHMLAHDGIEFLDLHLFGHVLFVLGRRVKMAGSGGRLQFYFFTHDRSPCAARGRRVSS